MSETTTIQISVETKKLLEYIKGWIILNNISKKDKLHIGDAVEQIASYYKDNVIDKGQSPPLKSGGMRETSAPD